MSSMKTMSTYCKSNPHSMPSLGSVHMLHPWKPEQLAKRELQECIISLPSLACQGWEM